ncbi:NADP-dependent oxidoreductase [Telmatobacter sp. DSM 110680]|uniref:NADP-dependent oxidoreductase n=1 Tax=Telmatobacter sp. DSM 110680 TaxID=3036704 RepID=A0AAU7DJJ5_9BACT
MPTESREVRLASRPQGEPSLDNFSFATVQIRDPNPGEVLVRNVCLSVDPYMRGRMNDAKSYVPPFQIGQPLEGGAVGRVIASQDEKFPTGTYVFSMYGWREAFVAPTSHLQIVDAAVAPVSAYLGLLGVTGLTAWVGINLIARLKVGETIFVSGGAGAVGNAACQLAKIHSCKVIGSAGSEEKVSFLRDQLKLDYAFNYRDGDPLEHLKRGAPDGIHVYFDNTGGPQLEAALSSLRNYGRIAMCGGIAGYNTPAPGPRNLPIVIGKRLRVEGFIVSDHFREIPAFLEEAVPALKSGKLINRETVVEGLDAAPAAFIDLLHSGARNIGKMIVKLSS